jgi:D-3-phosphoglycerate dehydrogenase
MVVVGRAGVGVDNIDISEATKKGIMVMNTPGGNTVSTAQLAVSLLASLARKVPAADMSVKDGKWDRKSFTGVELNGKTLGVVGCGRIGQVVAGCAQTMGMHVLGYDPVMTKSGFDEAGIEKAELSDIWAKCDFITVHTPLTKDTANLINDDTIAKVRVRVIYRDLYANSNLDPDSNLSPNSKLNPNSYLNPNSNINRNSNPNSNPNPDP